MLDLLGVICSTLGEYLEYFATVGYVGSALACIAFKSILVNIWSIFGYVGSTLGYVESTLGYSGST